MHTKREYSVTVLPDKEGEPFSSSLCDCKECKETHYAQREWETFIPKTKLQKRMVDVINKIENIINSDMITSK